MNLPRSFQATTLAPLFLLLSVPLAAAEPQRLAPLYADAAPVMAWEKLREVKLPDTVITSVRMEPAENAVRVTAVVSHPPASDRVTVWVALPLKNWNGRFRGNGGGGFVGGNPASLKAPVLQGFATAATDTGHEGGSGSFALDANGRPNWQLIRDNAYLGIHAMTVVGKALTRAFYGRPARYAYFVGSSTGGRQGLMEAQRFPDDYDGILSGCPAINWHRFVPASLWPQAVMFETGTLVSKAKLAAVTAAAVAAGDGLDGAVDGVIEDPDTFTWDPAAFVGTQVGAETFTAPDAEVVRRIWEGPRGHGGTFIWHGLTRGTDLTATAGTDGDPLVAKPFSIALDYFRYFLVHDPKWEGTRMGKAEFELWWNQSVEQYGAVLGTDNPDLTRFRARGGKVLIYHGTADQLIPHRGSIDYFERVQRAMGGAEATAEFARLFLIPGVNHGFKGPGPTPVGQFEALVHWVEEGKAPGHLEGEVRDASGRLTGTRKIRPYSARAR